MEEIHKKIQALCAEALAKIREAEKLAEEHKVSFYFSSVAYGMGGWFEGDPSARSSEDYGWHPSSHSC